MCQLQIGVCHGHLPSALQGLNHLLQQFLTLNTPGEEFRVDSRKEAPCAGRHGKLAGQVVRYFQELISWAQFLYLLIFRPPRNSKSIFKMFFLWENFNPSLLHCRVIAKHLKKKQKPIYTNPSRNQKEFKESIVRNHTFL